MGEITRREFIKSVGTNAVVITLFNGSNVFSNNFDTIDSLTEKMLEELGAIKRKNIKYSSGPNYYDDASVFICAKVPNYHIDYFVLADESEKLNVIGEENWEFCGEESSKEATELTSFGYTDGSKKFDPKIAVPAFTTIRDLLDIDVHSQNSKGKDLTSLVDDLSRKVLSIEKFKVEYNNDLNIEASFENGNFKIEYKFDEKDKQVTFTVRDEKNELFFYGTYDKDGGIDTINLDINSSGFELFSGKLEIFPRKVYNESSAMSIITKAKALERYLTSVIKNTKLENYTDLFERLTSINIDEQAVMDKGDKEITIKIGEQSIQYTPGNYDHIYLNSGNDRIYICAHRKTGRISTVIINNHPFLSTDDKINFIRSTYDTYTEDQANFIIQRAQQFYNNQIKPIGDFIF